MKVIAWNMNWRRSSANWSASGPGAPYRCDIALLNEARPAGDVGMNVVTRSRTVGRDDVSYGGRKQSTGQPRSHLRTRFIARETSGPSGRASKTRPRTVARS